MICFAPDKAVRGLTGYGFLWPDAESGYAKQAVLAGNERRYVPALDGALRCLSPMGPLRQIVEKSHCSFCDIV